MTEIGLFQQYPTKQAEKLHLALNLSPPPTDADKQEAPVVKELGLFALEGVADKLERPSHKKKHNRVKPQAVNEHASQRQGKRKENCRYAQGMAYPIHRMLMAAGILRDPLFVRARFVGAAAKHGGYDDTRLEWSTGKVRCRVERASDGVLAS